MLLLLLLSLLFLLLLLMLIWWWWWWCTLYCSIDDFLVWTSIKRNICRNFWRHHPTNRKIKLKNETHRQKFWKYPKLDNFLDHFKIFHFLSFNSPMCVFSESIFAMLVNFFHPTLFLANWPFKYKPVPYVPWVTTTQIQFELLLCHKTIFFSLYQLLKPIVLYYTGRSSPRNDNQIILLIPVTEGLVAGYVEATTTHLHHQIVRKTMLLFHFEISCSLDFGTSMTLSMTTTTTTETTGTTAAATATTGTCWWRCARCENSRRGVSKVMTGGGSSGEVSDVVDVDDHVISTKRKNCDNYCNKDIFFRSHFRPKDFPKRFQKVQL